MEFNEIMNNPEIISFTIIALFLVVISLLIILRIRLEWKYKALIQHDVESIEYRALPEYWHGYILIEDINPGWNINLLSSDLRANLGRSQDEASNKITVTRISQDNTAMIVKGYFESGEITREALIEAVGQSLGIQPGQVDAVLKITIMGGSDASLSESWQAMRAKYLSNRALWENYEEIP